jgi:hypothetical protein
MEEQNNLELIKKAVDYIKFIDFNKAFENLKTQSLYTIYKNEADRLHSALIQRYPEKEFDYEIILENKKQKVIQRFDYNIVLHRRNEIKIHLLSQINKAIDKSLELKQWANYFSPLQRGGSIPGIQGGGYFWNLELFGEIWGYSEMLIKEYNKLINPKEDNIIIGYKTNLTSDKLINIWNQMSDQNMISCSQEVFIKVFSYQALNENDQITWLIKNRYNKPHISTLFLFLKRIIGHSSNKNHRKASQIFSDHKGSPIIIKTYPKQIEYNSLNHFQNITDLPKLPD